MNHAPAEYRPPPVEQTQQEAPLTNRSWAYLIAARDGRVWLAREYSVDNGTLQFSTMGAARRELPLANVDRTATERLNRERGVAIQLP
jgi:hypothetical protein